MDLAGSDTRCNVTLALAALRRLFIGQVIALIRLCALAFQVK
jgi:hypothetical protein